MQFSFTTGAMSQGLLLGGMSPFTATTPANHFQDSSLSGSHACAFSDRLAGSSFLPEKTNMGEGAFPSRVVERIGVFSEKASRKFTAFKNNALVAIAEYAPLVSLHADKVGVLVGSAIGVLGAKVLASGGIIGATTSDLNSDPDSEITSELLGVPQSGSGEVANLQRTISNQRAGIESAEEILQGLVERLGSQSETSAGIMLADSSSIADEITRALAVLASAKKGLSVDDSVRLQTLARKFPEECSEMILGLSVKAAAELEALLNYDSEWAQSFALAMMEIHKNNENSCNALLESLATIKEHGVPKQHVMTAIRRIGAWKKYADNYGYAHEIVRVARLIESGRKIADIGRRLYPQNAAGFEFSGWVYSNGKVIRPTRPLVQYVEADGYSGKDSIVYEIKSSQHRCSDNAIRIIEEMLTTAESSGNIQNLRSEDDAIYAVKFVNQLLKYKVAVESGAVNGVEFHFTSQRGVNPKLIDFILQTVPNGEVFVYPTLSAAPSLHLISELIILDPEQQIAQQRFRLEKELQRLIDKLESLDIDRNLLNTFFDGQLDRDFSDLQIPVMDFSDRLAKVKADVENFAGHNPALAKVLDETAMKLMALEEIPTSKEDRMRFAEAVADVYDDICFIEMFSAAWKSADKAYSELSRRTKFGFPVVSADLSASYVAALKEFEEAGSDASLLALVDAMNELTKNMQVAIPESREQAIWEPRSLVSAFAKINPDEVDNLKSNMQRLNSLKKELSKNIEGFEQYRKYVASVERQYSIVLERLLTPLLEGVSHSEALAQIETITHKLKVLWQINEQIVKAIDHVEKIKADINVAEQVDILRQLAAPDADFDKITEEVIDLLNIVIENEAPVSSSIPQYSVDQVSAMLALTERFGPRAMRDIVAFITEESETLKRLFDYEIRNVEDDGKLMSAASASSNPKEAVVEMYSKWLKAKNAAVNAKASVEPWRAVSKKDAEKILNSLCRSNEVKINTPSDWTQKTHELRNFMVGCLLREMQSRIAGFNSDEAKSLRKDINDFMGVVSPLMPKVPFNLNQNGETLLNFARRIYWLENHN